MYLERKAQHFYINFYMEAFKRSLVFQKKATNVLRIQCFEEEAYNKMFEP